MAIQMNEAVGGHVHGRKTWQCEKKILLSVPKSSTEVKNCTLWLIYITGGKEIFSKR